MVRPLLVAGLLLVTLLAAPAASASHDHPDCNVVGDPTVVHYVCAVTVGAGIIVQPVVDFAQCVAADPKPTLSDIVACL